MERSKKSNQIHNASLTVEATLAFPIFFFAIMVFLYVLQTLYLQEHINFALTKTVEKASKYAYVYENMLSTKEAERIEGIDLGEEWIRNITGDGFLNIQFMKEVDRELVDGSCIKGGIKGIHFQKSSVMIKEKEIDAVADYKITISVPFISFIEIPICQRIKSRGFVGKSYSVKGTNNDGDDSIVYITPTGYAYHQYADCTYIRIILENVYYKNVAEIRNESGAKYYPCERCVETNIMENTIVHVSKYGDRFHVTKGCSGVKRTVVTIPLNQIGDRHACSKCYK